MQPIENRIQATHAIAINHFINSRCQAKDPDWHYTPYREGWRIFVLCEDCWKSMTPTQRLPYYTGLVEEYWEEPFKSEKMPLIKEAVLDGK